MTGRASERLDRRGFIRLLGGGALAVAGGAVLLPEGARAGITWCRADPIVRLQGTRVQFWVSVQEPDLPYVNGPIECRVQTPKAVLQELLFLDAGFNGHGEEVRFTFSNQTALPGQSFLTSIWVNVPNSKRGAKFPILVDIVPANGSPLTGTGNAGSTDVSLTIAPTL